MSNKSPVILLILLALALTQLSSSNFTAAASEGTYVTLYAHAHPSGQPGSTPILNALGEWGTQQAARLQEGEVMFQLDPLVGNNVTIDGTTTMRLYVKSDFRLTGFLAVYLTVTEPNGTISLTHAIFNDTVFLDTRPRDYNYIVALNDISLTVGSAIVLHVKLTSQDKVTSVSLLYDSASTPTQIQLPITDLTNTGIKFLTPSERPTRIFEVNSTSSNATVIIKVAVVDALGLYRLKAISLAVSNSSGGAVLSFPDIFLSGVTVSVHNITYATTLTLPVNTYTLTITVNDRAGKSYTSSNSFYVAPYYLASIRVVDTAYRPVQGGQVIMSNPVANYTSVVNETGLADVKVASSTIIGPYQMTVLWRNLTISQSAQFVAGNTSIWIIVEMYDLVIRAKLLNFDLSGTRIDILAGSKVVWSGVTNSTGHAMITQLPQGNYTLDFSYLGVHNLTKINMDDNITMTISLPIPHQEFLPYIGVLAGAMVATGVMLRRRRLYRWSFDYLNVLTHEGIPDSRTTTIAGNSGSGKTVLMESLALQSLKSGRGCVYVTNVELPSDVRTSMKSLGMDISEYESNGKLVFIDSYSSLSGAASTEKRSTGSLTDLTGLGILITRSIEEIGGTTDVYLDALTPLFTTLKTDHVVTFLQSIGAKVKSYNGGLCTILGTSVEKETITRVEEASDCVIETQLTEGRKGQRRRLRVKKLRGNPYEDTWTRFTISEEGIVFFTHKPP